MALLEAVNLSLSLLLLSGCREAASGVPGMEGGVQAQDQDQARAPCCDPGFVLLCNPKFAGLFESMLEARLVGLST